MSVLPQPRILMTSCVCSVLKEETIKNIHTKGGTGEGCCRKTTPFGSQGSELG